VTRGPLRPVRVQFNSRNKTAVPPTNSRRFVSTRQRTGLSLNVGSSSRRTRHVSSRGGRRPATRGDASTISDRIASAAVFHSPARRWAGPTIHWASRDEINGVEHSSEPLQRGGYRAARAGGGGGGRRQASELWRGKRSSRYITACARLLLAGDVRLSVHRQPRTIATAAPVSVIRRRACAPNLRTNVSVPTQDPWRCKVRSYYVPSDASLFLGRALVRVTGIFRDRIDRNMF